MKKNKKIIIFYDDQKFSGKGHYIRCKNLSEYLNKYYKISFNPFSNVNKFKKKIYKFDLIILDLKKYSLQKLNFYFKKFKEQIITIENYNNTFGYINIKIFDHSPDIKTKSYNGLKYAMIKKVKIPRIDINNQIFVSIGNNPKKKYLSIIQKKIKISKNYNFVLMPSMKKKDYFKYTNIKFCNANNYYEKFKNSSICITNGGLTLIEALYFKKICFAFPQNKYEANFINFLKKRKFVFGTNLDKINSLDIINMRKIKKRLKNIIDGNGLNRIKKIIEKNF